MMGDLKIHVVDVKINGVNGGLGAARLKEKGEWMTDKCALNELALCNHSFEKIKIHKVIYVNTEGKGDTVNSKVMS